MILNNCTISGNTASKNGGGLFSYDSYSGGTATLTNCTVSGNKAAAISAAAVFLKGRGSALNLTGCTISNNTANQAGGGLWLYGGYHGIDVTTLTNCTISGNTAGDCRRRCRELHRRGGPDQLHLQRQHRRPGGGGLMNDNVNSTTNLTNCTITGNTANGGGGLYNRGTVSVTSCTVTANSGGAKGGGGLFNVSSPATLTNTIVAGNTNGSNLRHERHRRRDLRLGHI